MANDGDKVRKELIARGYEVNPPTGRGKTYYVVVDPKNGRIVGRFPQNPSYGIWKKNLMAAIKRYERTGTPVRSDRHKES